MSILYPQISGSGAEHCWRVLSIHRGDNRTQWQAQPSCHQLDENSGKKTPKLFNGSWSSFVEAKRISNAHIGPVFMHRLDLLTS